MSELWRCVACGFEDITALRDGVNNHWRKGYTPGINPRSEDAICCAELKQIRNESAAEHATSTPAAGPIEPCPLGENCPDAHKYGEIHPAAAPDAQVGIVYRPDQDRHTPAITTTDSKGQPLMYAGPDAQSGELSLPTGRLVPDTLTHCDECDPSFGCFATGTPCSKRPPDAQTPRTEEELSDWGHCEPGFFAGKGQTYVRVEFARQLERENADLRRQLVGVKQVVSYQCDLVVDLHAKMEKLEEQLADARVAIEHLSPSCAALLGRAETAEADAREAREDASKAAKDAVRYANELVAERAIPRACRALEQDEVGAPCSYLRDAEAALAAERDDAKAIMIEYDLCRKLLVERTEERNAERAARETAQRLYEITLENEIRWMKKHEQAERERDAAAKDAEIHQRSYELQMRVTERVIAERDAAADLAREESAKLCDGDWSVQYPLSAIECAQRIRSTITDPAAAKQTMEDAARFQSLPKWMAAIVWNKESNLPPLGHLKHGFALDDLRVWLDDANAARKGEEGKL